MRLSARIAAVLLAAAGPPTASAQGVDSLQMAADARILSADSLLGRATGSPGAHAAARYIAGELGRIGIEPVADGSFLVSVPLLRVEADPGSRLILRTASDTSIFTTGRDFVMAPGGRGSLRGFAGPVVYLPPGAAGEPASLAGSVLLVTELPGEASAARMRAWQDAGVAALILPLSDDDALGEARDRAGGRLVIDAPVDDPIWQPELPIVYAGPVLVQALIAGAPRPTGTAAPVSLDRTLEGDLRFLTEPVAAANVAGILRGTDPAQRDSVVLLTAHYDHLGVGPAVAGDSIYNGFSDNAVGVAMLLGVARALSAHPAAKPVAFLFTTGEERGLLGSTAWAADPPIPLDRTSAVLNLDAGAPPAAPVRWRVAGDTTRAAVRTAAAIVRRHGWAVDLTGANANSDHWPFMAHGVPAIFLVPGRDWEGLSAAERDRLFERWDRYHQPGDEWRPDYPLAGVVRYAELALEIVRGLGN